MMMGLGFAEIMVLVLLTGGTNSTDLVSLVQPAHYFKSRQIELSIDRAIEYASDDPKTAKSQIVQLTALRYLAHEAEALKKAPKYAAHRQILEQIADGKKAQDSSGFAQDYAKRVLVAVDGVKPPAAKVAPIREDGLSWFPADATLAGVLDLQQTRQVGGVDPFKDLIKLIPDRDKEKMYTYLEKSGNIRADRISFAYTDGTGKRDGKIYMRFTGKGNHAWVVELLKMLDEGNGRMAIKSSKDEKGVPITYVQERQSPPVIMIVGNTDLLVIGHERNGNDQDLVDQVLEVRAKKKANANSGLLKDRLAAIPDKAVALLAGQVPEQMRRGFPEFNPVPTNITAFIERAPQGLDVHVETSMANADDAGKFVQNVGDLRKKGIDELKKAMQQPQPPGFPMVPYQSMIDLMQSLQVNSKTARVQVRLFVPDGLTQQLMSTFAGFAGPRGDLDPPEKAKEEKK